MGWLYMASGDGVPGGVIGAEGGREQVGMSAGGGDCGGIEQSAGVGHGGAGVRSSG